MKTIYIVRYDEGEYEDRIDHIIFATTNIETAIKYIDKFNRILKKWYEYYSICYNKQREFTSTYRDSQNKYTQRFYQLGCIGQCYFEETCIR